MKVICEDIDFNELAKRIQKHSGRVAPGSIGRVEAAIETLRDLPFAYGYLDSLREEILTALYKRKHKHGCVFVYLAFYGNENKASFLKIGIAANVQSRLRGIKTGNPLPNVFTYAARFETRQEAAAVESALLDNMSPDGVHGEWIDVHGMAYAAVSAVVESLAEVASDVDGSEVHFNSLGVVA